VRRKNLPDAGSEGPAQGCEKEIDKTHKKRYILFINARKKSVRRFRHPESRGLLKTRYGGAACCRF
jgi:hypothetical protein